MILNFALQSLLIPSSLWNIVAMAFWREREEENEIGEKRWRKKEYELESLF